jgi:hypothetical protein
MKDQEFMSITPCHHTRNDQVHFFDPHYLSQRFDTGRRRYLGIEIARKELEQKKGTGEDGIDHRRR